jgi:transposase-like protein
MKYSMGFRASIVRKTQDGSGRSIYQIGKESGVSPVTITNWIQLYRNGTLALDGADSVTPSQRSPGEKLSLLLVGKSLPEDQKGEWLRQQGLHSEHLPL